MKNTKRSAFTIVELVIVIAVIAILSAVLIPTFGAIIKDANEAADKAAASTLTSELHVYLKGETIDSEEELMAVLNDSGIGEKLVPKALSYGHHFWFDMANQMIIAAYPDDVAEMEPARPSSSAEHNGPALMSDVTPLADDTTYANVGIREVYDNGYYLITSAGAGGEGLIDALNLIETLSSAADYEKLIKYLNNAVAFDADNTAATAILNKVKDTTIRTQYGVFFYDGASVYEHISGAASYLSGPYYNYNPSTSKADTATAAPNPTGAATIELPSNIKAVMEGGLNYTSAYSTTVVMPSVDAVVAIFNPASSNAVISISDVDHIITTVTCDEHNDTCDVLAKKADSSIVKHLEVKLAFNDFYIGYDKADDTTHTTLENSVEANKIYVAHRNGVLQLHAVNIADANDISYKVQDWTIDTTAGNVGTLSINKKGVVDLTTATFGTVNGNSVCEVTFKATAKNVDGETREDTVTVVVAVPTSAYIKLGPNNIRLNSTDVPTLTFNGPLTSYALTASVNYSADRDGNNPLNIKAELEVSCGIGLLYESGKLTFETDDKGKLINQVLNSYSFDVKIDNYYEASVSVTVEDQTAAAVKVNYKQHAQANRPSYYVGSDVNTEDAITNELKLSDLFTVVNPNKFGTQATVTVYYSGEYGGKLSPVNEINKWYEAYQGTEGYTLRAEYTDVVTIGDDGNWNDATIRFIGNTSEVYNIFIEVAPEGDVSTVLYVEIIDGALNATTAAQLTNGNNEHTTDVILHADNLEITSGNKIKLGADKNFYGNGYVIDAEGYVSATSGTFNDYLMYLNGGTVDNIYLAGPTYPSLDYDTATIYHVSGIMTSGESDITNSYICGFRQPVMAAGTTTNISNTTLRGGNYGNLVQATGILNITDLTTIQDSTGIQVTVGEGDDLNKKVMGLGIVVEAAAINGVTGGLNIYGYLDQYNWVKYGMTGITLPTFPIAGTDKTIKTAEVLNCIFDGVTMSAPVTIKTVPFWGGSGRTETINVNVHAEMGSLAEFIHKDSTATSGYGQYVSAGIVFAELGAAAESYVIKEDFVKDYRNGAENNVSNRTMKILDIPFGKTGADISKSINIAVATVTVTANVHASDYLGTNGRFTLWGSVDGRHWKVDSIGMDDDYNITRTVSCDGETTNYVVSDAPIDGITGKLPLTYTDYYSTGVYAGAYN